MASYDFKRELDLSRQSKNRHELLWALCRLYLEGRQNVQYNRRQGRLNVHEVEDDGRYNDNAIKPLYKFVVSNLSVEYPSTSVLPASPSTEDILKARLSHEALAYYWAVEHFKDLVQRTVEWMACTGNAGWHTLYDPNDKLLHTELVPPENLFFPRGTRDTDKSPAWRAVRTLFDREVVKETYPEFAKAIEKVSAFKQSDLASQDDVVPEGTIEVFDVYRRDGTHEIRLEDTVLSEGEWNIKTTPIRHLWYQRTPGMLWGMGLVADEIDLQTRYNRLNRMVNQAIENLADPWILVPTGATIPPDGFRQGSSKVIRFNAAAGPPAAFAVQPISPEVLAEIQRVLGRMLDVAGVHSTSLGKTAQGVTSAKQVDSLKASDASQLQPTMGSIEAAVVDTAKTVLVMMKQHYTESRWVRFLDATGSLVSKHLDFTQVETDPEIVIEAGSLFRNETQDRRQKVLELFSLGLLSPEEAMQEVSFGTSNKFVLDRVQAMVHAQDLLEATKLGLEIRIYPVDDVPAIRRVFQEFMLNAEFYKLDLHIQDHIAKTFESMLPAPRVPQVDALAKFAKAQAQFGQQPGTPQVPGIPVAPPVMPTGQPAPEGERAMP